MAIALVIGLLIGAGATYALAEPNMNRTTTVTSVTTTTTILPAVTNANKTVSPMKYHVVFQQSGYCIGSPNISYESLWSVTLGDETELKTWNATQTISNDTVRTSGNQIFSTMVFLVPDGVYNFSISPNHFEPGSGLVTVNGSDVLVKVNDSALVDFCLP